MEGKVLELRQRLSEQMAKTVIEQQAAVRPVPGPSCAGCGTEMRYKGMKAKTVLSWVGELKLERGYSYCDQCRAGLFPLDQHLELWEKHWSEGLAKEAVWLSGTVPSFEQAEETLPRIGHVAMADSTIWRRVEKWGERFEQLEKERHQATNRLAQVGQVGPVKAKSAQRLGAGMDGAKIHIRQEGWKELKVGCVFEIEVRPIFDPDTQEKLEQGHAFNHTCLAHL